jgi:uncharacterized protein (DUF488 family)
MKHVTVFTTGYENSDIEAFITKLRKHRIRTVIDVREIPASRKPGFSKNKFKEHLNSSHIEYVHVKELGSPKPLRDKLKEDKDYSFFFIEYGKYITTKLDIVRKLYKDIICREMSCLVCFEREPMQCHRKVDAEKIKEIDGNGLTINHI